jgi:hypothetical protein
MDHSSNPVRQNDNFREDSKSAASECERLRAECTQSKELSVKGASAAPLATEKLVEQKQLPVIALTGSAVESPNWGSIANNTYDAMRKNFCDGDGHARNPKYYVESPDRSKGLASAWDMGEVLEADISKARLSGVDANAADVQQDFRILGHYWDKRKNSHGFDSQYGPRGDKYYDDNTWIGIAFLDRYKQDKDEHKLQTAKEIFDFELKGANDAEKLAHPGGVLWGQEPNNLYRAAVSTAGAAQLGLELYQQTHDQKYLQFASKQFDWVNDNLRAPDGLYYDGMDKDGTLHKEVYTYNQGLMLGDATMLFQATGDQKYLQQAQSIAKATLDKYAEKIDTANGKADNTSAFSKQLTFFNAVFFKNLMLLNSVAPDSSYNQSLSDYSTQLAKRIQSDSGLLKSEGKSTLLEQSSATQIFALAQENPIKV